jgi:hypothetical protein
VWAPFWPELFLKGAQTLEIVKTLATVVDQCCKLAPAWREPMLSQPGEWGHPETEPSKPFLLRVTQEAKEEEIHCAARYVGPLAHQIDCKLALLGATPDVSEGDDVATVADNSLVTGKHVFIRPEAE